MGPSSRTHESNRECPFCRPDWSRGRTIVAELGLSLVVLGDDQRFRGYSILVPRRHVTELWQLTSAERGVLIEETARAAAAVRLVTSASKMNVAFLGNQVSHLHGHIIPRHAGDPAWPRPIWSIPPEVVTVSPEEADALATSIREAMGRAE